MANLKIISPAKIMVGFINRDDYYYDHNGEYHKNGKSLIGFATFKEGSILRKEKSWNQWRDKNIAVQELDNIPTPGFKLKSVGQRSRDWFGTGRHVWQIVDPRGFVLEITSENMYALMEECDIIKGEIKADCVWAWSGANMSLVPTTSELYETVISNTNRVNTKADKSQLQIGNKVTLKDGTEGIYYGKYHALLRTYSDMKSSTVEILKLTKKKGKSYLEGTIWYATSEAKISSIDTTDVLSKEDVFNELKNITKLISSGDKSIKAGDYQIKAAYNLETISGYQIFHISNEPIKLKYFYVDEPITEEDFNKITDFNFLRNNGNYQGADFHKKCKKLSTVFDGILMYRVSRHEGYTKIDNDSYNQTPGRLMYDPYKIEITDKAIKYSSYYKSYSETNLTFSERNIFDFNDSSRSIYGNSHSEFLTQEAFKEKVKSRNFRRIYLNIEGTIVNF